MKLIPAIDLKENKCVRLFKGKEDTSYIYNNNPVEQAIFFEKEGCKRIHIVDLDAAFGRQGVNTETILNIRKSISIQIELGGGIRNQDDISFWLNNKINFLIIGSLAIKKSDYVKFITNNFEDKIYISLDHLNNRIMINGWVEESKYNVGDILNIYKNTKIRGFIFTDVSRDGMMLGMNINQVRQNLSVTKKPMIVGGGLSNYEDLKKLKKLENKNLEGIIAGKSFYSGAIEIKKGIKILN